MKTKSLWGIAAVIAVIFIAFGCVGAQSKKNFQSTAVSNPYGLFSLKAAPQTPAEGSAPDASAVRFSQDTFFQVAKDLGVSYLRINARLGRDVPDFDKARQLGFKIVLHVITREGESAAQMPTDLTQYKQQLGAMLDKYHPDILAIENEELNENFYGGTVEQYIAQMQAAIEVAHARGIKITNGGLPLGKLYNESNGQARNNQRKNKLAKGQQLIEAYRTLPLDYVNFHWYYKDPQALETAVQYLRQATGKEVITTEIGQYDASPEWVGGDLQETKNLKLPVVIWFNGDGKKAVALCNSDGSLRENGKAFKKFVAGQ